jgi:quercetin dioxygenase-like cupin family protein
MMDARDVIDNPVTGESVIFSKRAQDTGGDLLSFELVVAAGGVRMVEHVHLRQEERIEVVTGTMRYRLGGKEHGLAAGETVVLPPGVAHTLWNDGTEEARMLLEVRPALKAKAAFETLFGLARDGKTNKQGMPNPLQGALLALEYETFLARPPIPLQRAVLPVLAPIARLLGYRPRYPEYSGPE